MGPPPHNGFLLHVALVGMARRTRVTMLGFLRRSCSEACVPEDEPGAADAAIVDLDDFGAAQRYREHRARYPGQQLIVLSARSARHGDGLYLRKPFVASEMRRILDSVRRRTWHAGHGCDRPPLGDTELKPGPVQPIHWRVAELSD